MDYEKLAQRLEAAELKRPGDHQAILALLGYEVAEHGRLGLACRPGGVGHWQSLPWLHSADSAETWLHGKVVFETMEQSVDDVWTAHCCAPEQDAHEGKSARSLGRAMWAAFVRAAADDQGLL